MNEQLKTVIKDYLCKSNSDYAILIDGEWGTGKTYCWKNEITEFIQKLSFINTSKAVSDRWIPVYISLYGIQNVSDLTHRILEETFPLFKKKVFKLTSKVIGAGFAGLLSHIGIQDLKLSDIKNITEFYKDNLSKYVICFDDLERLNPEVMLDVLGYINSLIEHQHVKTVFLCDESKITNPDYDKYKEKSIRFKFKYNPDIPDIVSSIIQQKGVTQQGCFKIDNSKMIDVLERANCVNLRTIKYVFDIWESIYPFAERIFDNKQDVWMFLFSLISMYCIEYKSGRKRDDLMRLYEMHEITSSRNRLLKAYLGSDEDGDENYVDRIQDIYFQNQHILGSSMALINYITTGFLELNELQADLKNIQNNAIQYRERYEIKLLVKVNDFWNLDDNEVEQTVEELINCVEKSMFILHWYPLVFLYLYRLQKFQITKLPMSLASLKSKVLKAIQTCKEIDDSVSLDRLYREYYDESDDFKEIATKVIEVSVEYKTLNISKSFSQQLNRLENDESLNEFSKQSLNIFSTIDEIDFHDKFINYSSYKKNIILNFFSERYDEIPLAGKEKDFIQSLVLLLDKDIEKLNISPTKFYCIKLKEIFQKKL